MKTKALFGKKYLDLTVRELELPPLDGNQVLVKVKACGVCGTDLNFVRDWNDAPMPLGHEIAGEVFEVGREVTGFAPGDRVIVEDCALCGVCTDCKSGNTHLCRNMFDMGGRPGMSEYMVIHANNLNKFDGMDDVSACMTEPLAVAFTAVIDADIPLGGSVMVFGPGPIGLMTAKLARLRGAGFVGITGTPADTPLRRSRLELAGKLGCDLIVQAGPQSIEEEVKKQFPRGVDRVIVTSPPQSMRDAFKIIRFGGIITFLGLSFGGKNVIDFDVNAAIFNKTTLRPVFAEPAANFPAAAALLKSRMVDAALFQPHCCSFDTAADTMRSVLEGTAPVIKPVFLPWGGK